MFDTKNWVIAEDTEFVCYNEAETEIVGTVAGYCLRNDPEFVHFVRAEYKEADGKWKECYFHVDEINEAIDFATYGKLSKFESSSKNTEMN